MLLVDGSSMLHRSLHTGLIELKTSDGRFRTGGIHGMMNSLAKAVKQFGGKQGVFVAWDLGGSARRRGIFEDYKKKQHDTDPEGKIIQPTAEEQTFVEALHFSRKWLHSDILPRMGCISVLVREIEGDDIVSWMCRLGPRDETRYIISCDRDLLQLVDEDTHWYDPQRDKYYDVDAFISEFKLEHYCYQSHYILTKALTGDGDFPGLGERVGFKGLGEATSKKLARAWLNQDSESEIRSMRFGNEFLDYYEIWKQNYRLADLLHPPKEEDDEIRQYVYKSLELDMKEQEHELGAIFDQFELLSCKQHIGTISESNFYANINTKLKNHFYV